MLHSYLLRPLLRPCALFVVAAPAFAGTRFVDVSLVTGANNGTSWADAFRGVEGVTNALTAAVGGDEIWVARGTYKPTSTLTRTLSITLKTGVAVYGGFAGGETLLAQRNVQGNVAILSGDLAGDDGSNIFTDNSFHVINGNSAATTAILDGFVVRGGNANSTANQDRGGGILMLTSSNATVRNCTFRDNRCTFGGGAGYINASSPSFTDCRFENNSGGSFGGAFDQSTNVGTVFTRCVFTGNTAGRAGAIEIFSSSPVKVYDCLFYGNSCTASGGGGAVFVSGSTPSFRNCTIFGNTSTTSTAAGFVSSSSTVEVSNCIVYGNTGPGGAQAAVNQISGTTYNVTYSCVQGGFAGTGNIASDPALANVGGANFHPVITSACIDAGDNAVIPPALTTDLDGRTRLVDEPTVANTGAGTSPIVDMGAYEFQAPIIGTFCNGEGGFVQCPCGNNAAFLSGQGCLNSLGVGGLLAASGTARLSNDTLLLSGTQMPNDLCVYFQGPSQAGGGAGSPFGDGLLCLSGTLLRLSITTNVASASQFGNGGVTVSAQGGVSGMGIVRNYQVWYRDGAAFCQSDTFNLTNAIAVTWEQ